MTYYQPYGYEDVTQIVRFRAEDLPAGPVTSWADTTGNCTLVKKNDSGSTSPDCVVDGDGRKYVELDATEYFEGNLAGFTAPLFEVFGVIQTINRLHVTLMLSVAASSVQYGGWLASTGSKGYAQYRNNTTEQYADALALSTGNKTIIHGGVKDTNTLIYSRNGEAFVDHTTSAALALWTPDRVFINESRVAGGGVAGQQRIYEVMAVLGPLTDAQRLRIVGKLAHDHLATQLLPTSHPYASQPPVVEYTGGPGSVEAGPVIDAIKAGELDTTNFRGILREGLLLPDGTLKPSVRAGRSYLV